jgi:hypothetical protein
MKELLELHKTHGCKLFRALKSCLQHHPSTLNLLFRAFQHSDWISPHLSQCITSSPFFPCIHHPNTSSEQRMVMNFHPWRWGLYVFHPLTRRLWNFSFINVKVMWSLSTSKQKVISGNQLEDIGYWGYKTFHPPTRDYRVAFNSLFRRVCVVVTQLEDSGNRNYETFHPY